MYVYLIIGVVVAAGAAGFCVVHSAMKDLIDRFDALRDMGAALADSNYGLSKTVAELGDKLTALERKQEAEHKTNAKRLYEMGEKLEEYSRAVEEFNGELCVLEERLNSLRDTFEGKVAQQLEAEEEMVKKQNRVFEGFQNLLDYGYDTALKGRGE